MEPLFPKIFTKRHILGTFLMLLLIVDLIGLTEYRSHQLFNKTSGELQVEKIEKEGLESRIAKLEAEIEGVKGQNEAVINTSNSVLEEIGTISNTVGQLNKLVNTDPELLQKYSKTYFLNEHYVPTEIKNIDASFVLVKDKSLQIHAQVASRLDDLLSDARDYGFHLGVVSAYRTFGEQSILKSTYKFSYGAGTANQFSAEQGYSEHQLGTTVDFVTPETADTLDGFDKTIEFVWLMKNAYRYGFILSYPDKNPYYKYEPWHWRFVGLALAKKLHDDNQYFYEMDQREINTYLGNIFD
jgi:LAS superfamily LD-carboxypeptidase LdcB